MAAKKKCHLTRNFSLRHFCKKHPFLTSTVNKVNTERVKETGTGEICKYVLIVICTPSLLPPNYTDWKMSNSWWEISQNICRDTVNCPEVDPLFQIMLITIASVVNKILTLLSSVSKMGLACAHTLRHRMVKCSHRRRPLRWQWHFDAGVKKKIVLWAESWNWYNCQGARRVCWGFFFNLVSERINEGMAGCRKKDNIDLTEYSSVPSFKRQKLLIGNILLLCVKHYLSYCIPKYITLEQ